MRLAVSNIAWDINQDNLIVDLLGNYSIDAIDIAPGKYFPDFSAASSQDIRRIKAWWGDRGIEITGMQSLLFGTHGLNVFGCEQSRESLLSHLRSVCRIGGELGATRIVFGSPRNRDRSGLDDAEVEAIAIPFFHSLGNIAQEHGVTICLEPNPTCYGSNFMTDSTQTVDVIRKTAHPAIGMQFDTGAIHINQENPEHLLATHAALFKHVHASEPALVPLGDGSTDHRLMSAALEKYLPGHVVSIEMVATAHEDHLVSIERAIRVAVEHYRGISPDSQS
jgi:D-psicose/D-tagatose/L-ribulose 3-epimerase